MRWCWEPLVILLALVALAMLSSAEEPIHSDFVLVDPWDWNVTLGPLYTLDSNGMGNVSGILVVDLPPPYHGNEPFTLGIIWPMYDTTADPNLTVTPTMGLDAPSVPDEVTLYRMIATDVDSDPDPGTAPWVWFASLMVYPDPSNTRAIGRMVWGNGTLNLTRDIEVGPGRVLLSVRIGTPNGTWEGEELSWATLPLLFVNEGGAGAIDLTVDIRYGGRITDTRSINLVPPLGDHPVDVDIMPLHGHGTVEVHLVTGPGAPRMLSSLNITVTSRPVLDVVSITVEPGKVVTGGKVSIEAVVRNRGNATTTGQRVDILVDGNAVANASIRDLGPGNETVVSAGWTMRGQGIHTVSTVAEGDEFAAQPVAVEVRADSPGVGAMAATLALLAVIPVARRSRSGGRA